MHEKKQEEFCNWAIKKLNKGAIFIYSDESWLEVSESVHYKFKVTKHIN